LGLKVKRRSKALSELFASYKPYENRIGRKENILVTEESHDKLHYVGHNKFYEQILVPKDIKYLGKMIEVEITSSGKHFMVGSPVRNKTMILSSFLSFVKKPNLNYKSVWISSCCIVLCSSLIIKILRRL